MDPKPVEKIYNVLFLCHGNSARSIMAEAILGRDGAGRFQSFSAGSHPIGTINPLAMTLLKKLNYAPERLRSKSWDEFAQPDAPVMDFVFTVCDEIAAGPRPCLPGEPMMAHWGVPDPIECWGTEAEKALMMADVYRMLSNRIGVFVNLPLRSLNQLSLQRRLREIGEPPKAEAS